MAESTARALAFTGGVPQLIVPDNPKAMIADANRYELRSDNTVLDFARHYGTSILPARPRHPQDKAKAESAVQIVGRWAHRQPCPQQPPGWFTTTAAHMPAAHRVHMEWMPTRLIHWGQSIGPATAEAVTRLMAENSIQSTATGLALACCRWPSATAR